MESCEACGAPLEGSENECPGCGLILRAEESLTSQALVNPFDGSALFSGHRPPVLIEPEGDAAPLEAEHATTPGKQQRKLPRIVPLTLLAVALGIYPHRGGITVAYDEYSIRWLLLAAEVRSSLDAWCRSRELTPHEATDVLFLRNEQTPLTRSTPDTTCPACWRPSS